MAAATKAALIGAVQKHAQDHYEDGGWDVIVECYTPEQIWDYLMDMRRAGVRVNTPKQAIAAMWRIAGVHADRQAATAICERCGECHMNCFCK